MVLSLIKGLKPPLLLVFSFSKHSALHARFWRGCIVCGKNSKFYWLVVRPCPAFFSRIFMSLCFVAVRINLAIVGTSRACVYPKKLPFSPITQSHLQKMPISSQNFPQKCDWSLRSRSVTPVHTILALFRQGVQHWDWYLIGFAPFCLFLLACKRLYLRYKRKAVGL